jgi:hypothetical protein
MNKKEFIEKHCKICKEKCEKGLMENRTFIRCVDKYITEKKENTSKK